MTANQTLLVTGGAGFIGSNVVASLNEAGHTDVVVNDLIGHDDAKWRNLAKHQVADLVPPAELTTWLHGRKLDAVIHMGAISDTTATDGDLVMENNFRLSLRLLDWCTATRTPFIYASSAATYGDGGQGFVDDWSLGALRKLQPMNLYGWSKHLFDLALVDRYFKKAGLKGTKVNDLRHTFIAHQLKAGVHPETTYKHVGHKRLSSTQKYLEHIEIKEEATLTRIIEL